MQLKLQIKFPGLPSLRNSTLSKYLKQVRNQTSGYLEKTGLDRGVGFKLLNRGPPVKLVKANGRKERLVGDGRPIGQIM